MKEYIEKEALLELYSNTDGLNIDSFHVPIEVIRQNIIDQPTTDVREVVHAKWIKMHGNLSMFFKCSKCGACNEFWTRYCPNCGAKMDLK